MSQKISLTENIPHLTTALTGPLQFLEKYLLEHQNEIETWFQEQWQKSLPPFYCSVDLRNAGFKLAPVDTNLFPAGFNNLNPDFMSLCTGAVQKTLQEIAPETKRILIIPESHTRNVFYFENVAALAEICHKAGLEVRIASLLEQLTTAKEVQLPSGRVIKLEPLQRQDDKVVVNDFVPDFILLNNDLSEGAPKMLEGLQQTIMPSLQLGWSNRLKSKHFRYFDDVCRNFVAQFDLDPWLISSMYRQCGEVNFMTREGEDCLTHHTSTLLQKIQHKYEQNEIKHKPFVVIKADAGTYGMSVMMVNDPAQIKQLNRKQRAKMAAAKGGQMVTKVIIQEGVYTFETWGKEEAVAEPVVYMIGNQVVGGFYRVHNRRGPNENLNSPGMDFKPLAFAETCCNPDKRQKIDCGANRFYAYGVVGRLAGLAAAKEIAGE